VFKIENLLKFIMAALLCLHSISSYSAFMVTQTSFGVDLDNPITKDTTLINQSNKPVRVRVDFAKPEWAKAKYYLGDQLVAYPKIVQIPAKGKVQVRIAPRIKQELLEGEYVALLVFKELPSRKSDGQVTMLMNIGIPYYARKGKLTAEIDFGDLRIVKKEEGYQLTGKLLNNGNYSYSLNILVKFFKNNKLLRKENFKQGFYREYLVELSKTILMDTNSDYVEITFYNKKIDFFYEFTFLLNSSDNE
jgi:P pilus assembly chaperone PapD